MAAENVRRMDFTVGTATEDGIIPGTEQEMVVLYNETIISDKEVRKLVMNQMADHDLRVIYTTKIQADFLRGEDYREKLKEEMGVEGKEEDSSKSNYEVYATEKQPKILKQTATFERFLNRLKDNKKIFSADVLEDQIELVASVFGLNASEVKDAVDGKEYWCL